MEITQEKINAAYNVVDENTKKVLDTLGEQKPKNNRPVTERIKTFEDAVRELGEDNPFVQAYYNNALFDTDGDNSHEISDVIAYLKLRIIVAALNEGWTPSFTTGEYRCIPYFVFYTNKELKQLSEEDKSDIHSCWIGGRSNDNANAYGGFAYAHTYYGSSYLHTDSGSQLAFKSEELAEYAGNQFIEIYAQMMGLEFIKNDK